jgi:hypothetical protein
MVSNASVISNECEKSSEQSIWSVMDPHVANAPQDDEWNTQDSSAKPQNDKWDTQDDEWDTKDKKAVKKPTSRKKS